MLALTAGSGTPEADPPEPGAGAASAGRRSFLFVTAPFGPFSRRLARRLRGRGDTARRVLLNGGDLADWGFRDAVRYGGAPEAFPAWILEEMRRSGVTDLITHGDTNPYVAAALRAAADLGIRSHVFEQGYLRPHWITLESEGVNAHSALSRRAEDYGDESPPPPHRELGRTAPLAVWNISLYHFLAYVFSPLFPRHRTPYAHSPFLQCLSHIRRYALQRLLRRREQRRLGAFLTRPGLLYLVLLQRPGDSQLVRHSTFRDGGRSFIWRVIGSFAAHAPKDARLIIKSHPLDHGLEPHRRHVRRSASAAGVLDRVYFADDGDLNAMLPHARAVISVNSTAGFAALEAGAPTLAMGRAIYDLPGLTHQSGLDRIWENPEAPDPQLFARFRAAVLRQTQINGAFATREGIELAIEGVIERLTAGAPQAGRYVADIRSRAVSTAAK